MQNRSVVGYYSSDELKRKEWAKFWNEKGLVTVEILIGKSSGIYCVGNEITMADCFLFPQGYLCISLARLELLYILQILIVDKPDIFNL